MSAVTRTARSAHRTPILIEAKLAAAVVAAYAKEGVITPQNAFRIDAIANSERLAERLQRRAMEAVVWGLPLVKFDMLRQAFFRDAQARYGDIAFWSRPADWNLQWTAPTAFAFYTYFNFNTKSGPVVFDIPPTREAGLTGSLFNARDERMIDIGVRGADRGRGGKVFAFATELQGSHSIPVHPCSVPDIQRVCPFEFTLYACNKRYR
jgi:hypothetical protein